MPIRLTTFAPIPEDTARSACLLFGSGNLYLRVGQGINDVLRGLLAAQRTPTGALSENHSLYALMTVIQFTEKLTDNQVLEAILRRVELKYALHLPLYYASLDPGALCAFRQRLIAEAESMQRFQALLDRLQEADLLNHDGGLLQAEDVLAMVCTGKRLETITQAMLRALAALALCDAEWLRTITRPHWYQRYHGRARMNFWPGSGGGWQEKAITIGADIRYVLDRVEQSGRCDLQSLAEIQALCHVWREQFIDGLNEDMKWRPGRCVSCPKKDEARPEPVIHLRRV